MDKAHKPYWCVVDYEEFFVLVRTGYCTENGPFGVPVYSCEEDYVVNTPNYDTSSKLWSDYNEIQFTPNPFENVTITASQLFESLVGKVKNEYC